MGLNSPVPQVYIISPAFNFAKEIQLIIYHFAFLRSREDCEYMSFLSASSCPQYVDSQPVYKFKELRGGGLCEWKSFGSISLRHFCLVSTGSSGKQTSCCIIIESKMIPPILPISATNKVLNYSALLYRNSPPLGPCENAVFSIVLKQALYYQVFYPVYVCTWYLRASWL